MATPLPAEPALAGGNHYPKYTVRNPVARRLVDGFLAALAELAQRSGARRIHEIGCGEGFLSTMLAERGFAVRGTLLESQVEVREVRTPLPWTMALCRRR
jgi:2-polyprenyl-3-methyl-5-hydroxy-6-metoxy-1,4-benzoquinol methylase